MNRKRTTATWMTACLYLAAWSSTLAAAPGPRRPPERSRLGKQAVLDVVVEDATDAGAQSLGLSVCKIYAQFASPDDRLLSVGFGSIATDDPQGFFQVPPPLGGDTAPLQESLLIEPSLKYDSFVTIGLDLVPDGVTDGTAPDPDFNSTLFGDAGQLVGGWFNVPPTNGQGQPGEGLRVLIAQLSVRAGFSASGTVTIFSNDGAQPFVDSFVCACMSASACGDMNSDGRRDDACAWYDCVGGSCVTAMRSTQADMGGQFGNCPIDGTCDGNDRFHALNCFSNQSASGTGPYPCEPSPPNALNVDAGGPASCDLDGVCDGNDAFHGLNCFSNLWFDGTIGYQCGCSGPAPSQPSTPLPPRGQANIVLKAPVSVRPGDLLTVDVHLQGTTEALRGYQLHMGATSGLELVDIAVHALRPDYAFAGIPSTWSAFNRDTAQMVVGMDAPEGVPVPGGAYLATFTYSVPLEATGNLMIELLHDAGAENSTTRTFLFGPAGRPIGLTPTTPARISVTQGKLSP